MFGLGFTEILFITILLICFVNPKDYKTLLIQAKKMKLSIESLMQELQQNIMLLDDEAIEKESLSKQTDSSKKT